VTRFDRRLLFGFSASPATLREVIFAWVRLPEPPPPLPAPTRAAVLAALRAHLEGRAAAPLPATQGLDRPAHLPVFVTVYVDGRVAVRRQATGPTLAAALQAAAPPALPTAEAARARVKVDLVTARGPVPWRSTFLFGFAVAPGVDGLVLDFGGRTEWFLPDDLVENELLTGLAPFAFMEFEFGLAVPNLTRLAALRMAASREGWSATDKRWQRFRTEAFVEPAAGVPDRSAALAVFRANTPAPALNRTALRAAAIAGGRYLLDKLHPDGSFLYQYDTFTDRSSSADYSLPRHFGAAMYLAQLGRYTHDPAFREGARRAFGYFEPHAQEVMDETGSAALAVLALTEYRLAEDNRYDATLRRLGDFLLGMQRPGGDFDHLVYDRPVKLMYYDGEAAFALTRLAQAFGEPRYQEAARRALDWLTHDAYDHFAGGFYFGEDHWTCMAAEAAYPLIDSAQYARFCDHYAAFLRRTQFQESEGPDDFTGAYGFTPFFPPHSTPAASRTEAMISAYVLGRRRGHPVEATRRQVVRSLRYLLAQQIRSENSYLMANPARALGGWMQSPLRRFVRIDFVQHAGDALLRGQDLVPE